MTADELMQLKKGDVVGHSDCCDLTFEVSKVVLEWADDENPNAGQFVYRVETHCVQGDGESLTFSFEDGSLAKLTAATAVPKRLTPYQITCQGVKRIEELGQEAFARHVLLNGHDDVRGGSVRSWGVGQPGTNNRYFRLTVFPGYLIVTGDNGECIWCRSHDMLSWAAGAIHSIDYFAEKVPSAIPTEKWSRDKAEAWVWNEWANRAVQILAGDYSQPVRHGRQEEKSLSDVLEENGETRDSLLARLDDDGGASFNSFLYHKTDWIDGCDFPDLEVFNSNFLWCREAVRCGLKLLGYLPRD